MKLKLLVISMVGVMTFATASYAADSSKAANTKPVNSWTCEDFLALDDSFQPTAISFAEGLNSHGKPEAAVLNVEGIQKITPMVVEACKQNPKESFKDKVKSEWMKIKKDM